MSGGAWLANPGQDLELAAQATIVALTPTKLVASTPTSPARQGVWVQAPSSNSAPIWIGRLDVSNTKGCELKPGQLPQWFPICDPSHLYGYALVANQVANTWWV